MRGCLQKWSYTCDSFMTSTVGFQAVMLLFQMVGVVAFACCVSVLKSIIIGIKLLKEAHRMQETQPPVLCDSMTFAEAPFPLGLSCHSKTTDLQHENTCHDLG